MMNLKYTTVYNGSYYGDTYSVDKAFDHRWSDTAKNNTIEEEFGLKFIE